MCILANSEDQDEMPHNVAFHQGLHGLLGQKGSPEKFKKYNFYLEIVTCDPLLYTCSMDHSKFIVSNQKELSISTLRVKSL